MPAKNEGPEVETIWGRVEYALYALAVREPALFSEAERFVGGMIASDIDAYDRVQRFLYHEQLK